MKTHSSGFSEDKGQNSSGAHQIQRRKQKLVEQRSTFDTIFNQAPIGISISYSSDSSDAISDVDTQINSMFEQIAGRTKEEMIELGWANITSRRSGEGSRVL